MSLSHLCIQRFCNVRGAMWGALMTDHEPPARVIIKSGLHYIGDVTGSLKGHNRALKHYELSAKEYFAKHP